MRRKNKGTEPLRLKIPTDLEFRIPFLGVFGITQPFSWSGLSSCEHQPLLKLPTTSTVQIRGSNLPEGLCCKERSYCVFLLSALLPETFCSPFLRHYTCSDFCKKTSQKNSSPSILLHIPGYVLDHAIINSLGRHLVLVRWHRELPSIAEGRTADRELYVVREGRFTLAALTAV